MRRSLLLFITVAILVAASPVPRAVASTVAWERIDITLHTEQSGGVILVQGTLPSTVTLPAEVELWAPAGSELQWAGEILDGPPSEDPSRDFSKTTEGPLDIYRFTLLESHQAQIEVLSRGDVTADGSEYASSLVWIPAQDVSLVRLLVRVPETAQVIRSSPGATLVPGDPGFAYYTRTIEDAKAGEALELAFGYTLQESTVSSGDSGGQASSVGLVVAIGLGALAILLLLVIVIRRELRSSSAESEPHEAPRADEQTASADRSAVEIADDAEAGTAGENGGVSHTGAGSAAKRNLLVGVVAVALILIVVIVAGETTKPKVATDSISQTFASGDPCLTVTIPLDVPNGSDPEVTAAAIFEALGPIDGLNTATYRIGTSTLDVGFCESKTSESIIAQTLQPTGLVLQD